MTNGGCDAPSEPIMKILLLVPRSSAIGFTDLIRAESLGLEMVTARFLAIPEEYPRLYPGPSFRRLECFPRTPVK